MSGQVHEFVSAALGQRKLTLLVKNANLLNVFTGETYEAAIGAYKERIVYVGPDSNAPAAMAVTGRPLMAVGMVSFPSEPL